jgi:hypothetical protein
MVSMTIYCIPNFDLCVSFRPTSVSAERNGQGKLPVFMSSDFNLAVEI